MKKWLKITLGVLLVMSVTSLLAFVGSQPDKVNCYDVNIKIKAPQDGLFVTEAEIMERFSSFCTSETKVDLKKIENHLNEIPCVRKSQVFKNINGSIQIEVELKRVIGRIINKTGESYYIDSEGTMMPIIDGKP